MSSPRVVTATTGWHLVGVRGRRPVYQDPQGVEWVEAHPAEACELVRVFRERLPPMHLRRYAGSLAERRERRRLREAARVERGRAARAKEGS